MAIICLNAQLIWMRIAYPPVTSLFACMKLSSVIASLLETSIISEKKFSHFEIPDRKSIDVKARNLSLQNSWR